MLRLVGSLVLCALQIVFVVAVLTHFHSAWRWLVVPLGVWGMVGDGRGVTSAVRDLRRPDAVPTPE
ncbi:hypothetical protein [Streptomyces sp. NBC_01264]|uniref:hypothetical protein n=1 Tax=Streptomyces sp. NBC_01264 TaxID=2903804 RepID=UPI00225C2909|nr:hypothetical protein [Streptomyces sp. NBC_01264]MCX4781855.1 hypothetical protein [Streptomyces sp. NBC_01264]